MVAQLLAACGDPTATSAPSTTTAAATTAAAKTAAAGTSAAGTTGAATTSAAGTTAASTLASITLPSNVTPVATSSGKTKIIFALQATAEVAPLYLGIDKGYFAANNLDVELTFTNGTSDLIPLVATGQASGGISTWAAAFFNAAKNKSTISILASVSRVPKTGRTAARLIVNKGAYDSGQVKTVADLKGKKVAIPGPGAFAEYSVNQALKTVGLTSKDVELTNIPFTQMAAAIRTSSVVAAFASEPVSTQLEAEGAAVTLIDGQAAGTELSFITFNNDFVNNNTAAVERFLAVYIKTLRDLDAGGWNDPEVQKIVEKYTKVQGSLLSKIAFSDHTNNDVLNIDSIRAQETYFRDRGVLSYSGELDIDALTRKDVVQQALQWIKN